MNILLLGSGGREHALADKIASSDHCDALYIAPGNAGTSLIGQNVEIDPCDFDQIRQLVKREQIGMVVVGPEAPLVKGIADYFSMQPDLQDVRLIGPSMQGAMLEGSKDYAKAFMHRHQIPTAAYRSFTADELEDGLAYLATQGTPIVLKADGLAAGKGVVICDTVDLATTELQEMLSGKFGEASERVVVEQFLTGIEFSVFVLTDGKDYVLLPEAKDYKRIGEGDTGLNTGGMGAVSPVAFADDVLWEKVKTRIIQPTVEGLQKETIPYIGFIFFGLMVVEGEPYVIEYNCRLGDPETEVVLPRLQTDIVELMMAAAEGRLTEIRVETDPRHAVTIMLVSGGYPGEYEKGKVLTGLELVDGSRVYHAGTDVHKGQVVTAGGRVLALTSMGSSLQKALDKSLRNAEIVGFEGKYFRGDIGRDLMG